MSSVIAQFNFQVLWLVLVVFVFCPHAMQQQSRGSPVARAQCTPSSAGQSLQRPFEYPDAAVSAAKPCAAACWQLSLATLVYTAVPLLHHPWNKRAMNRADQLRQYDWDAGTSRCNPQLSKQAIRDTGVQMSAIRHGGCQLFWWGRQPMCGRSQGRAVDLPCMSFKLTPTYAARVLASNNCCHKSCLFARCIWQQPALLRVADSICL